VGNAAIAVSKFVAAAPGVDRVGGSADPAHGTQLRFNVAADFADGIPSEDVESSIDRISRDIRARFPEVRRVFLEVERSRPSAAG
jgi:divalent metal cation (Fe/Co/Zn/Cd) transporter